MRNKPWLGIHVAIALLASPAARALVISEINYHPPAGDEALEFVEIANDSTTPEDISGWAFTEGIGYQFPPGTILGPRGFLVVCLNRAAFKARYGFDALGDFTGRLDNNGEKVTLSNQALIPILTVDYKDGGRWPTAPDGTGHTLVLRSTGLDPAEPESWDWSPQLGGSPGRPNFSVEAEQFVDEVLVDSGVTWRYAKGTGPFSTAAAGWRDPAFDDGAWPEGLSGFGYGDGDDRTVLDDMAGSYTSVAIHKRVTLTAAQLQAGGDFLLGVDYDDGFCAWLNGVEVARSNCGAPGEERTWDAVATASHEAGAEELYPVARALLRPDENVLAIVGYNFSSTSSDFSLIPRLIIRHPALGGGAARPPLVLNELYRGAAGAGWVELYNSGDLPVDLSLWRLTDDPARPDPYLLPSGSSIAGHGFLVVNEAGSGLLLSAAKVKLFLLSPAGGPGGVAAASRFDRGPPDGAGDGPYSEERFPDGGPLDWVSTRPTPGAPNQVDRVSDVVINEILYHPPEERPGEFIELYNRGASAVDMSGFSFDKGIDFLFPAGTSIEAGGYLVVAQDPGYLLQWYGYDKALGPFGGKLSNSGERIRLVDRSGNPVNEVGYSTGGSWPGWADGGGSSVELVDARQDNSLGAAWEDSDETGKADWERLSYTVAAYVPAAETELHLFLAGSGICHIDDVSIQKAGGSNYIPNPGFETTTSPWRIEGTHGESRRITGDSHGGSACLELISTGKGDTLVNRIETDTGPRLPAGAYEVSLWARWLRGSSLLVAHGEFTAGPNGGRPSPATNLSGNTLGGRLRLTVPRNVGTPGAENSATARLRQATGEVNQGPLISGVRHHPVSPASSIPVTVTALVRDADGVASVKALYALNSSGGAFTGVDLLDDGLHGDGAAGDGVYGGQLPGFAVGTRVLFTIEAADTRGAVGRFPAGAPGKTCLYQVQGTLNDRLDVCRVVLDAERTAELASRPLHSNDLLDGVFVFNDEEAFYNIGLRYRGSPWGRPGRNSFRVRFEDDHPFRRGRKFINLSSRGAAANEGAAYFFCGRNGTASSPVPAAEYLWVHTWLNGSSLGTQAAVQTVDGQFMERWFSPEATGPVLKAVGRIAFSDAGALSAWDGASFTYMGDVSENYRGYFTHSVRESVDWWDPFFALTKTMDPKLTTNVDFDAKIDGILDVEEFLRDAAVRILDSDADAFTIGNGHNGYLVFDPRDGRWRLLPFDMDLTWGSPTPNLFPNFDPAMARLMARPGPRRTYLRVLSDALGGYWSAATAGPWLDAIQAATGVGTGGIKSFIASSAGIVKSQISTYTQAKFLITTNGGNPIHTDAARIDLDGDAPVQAAIITQLKDGQPEVLKPVWTTATHWKMSFDIAPGPNRIELYGFDGQGNLVGSASIDVDSAPGVGLQVTDWSPRAGPSEGGTRVTFQGSSFADGLQVLFGGVPATDIAVSGGATAAATAPPAPSPLPAGGVVDIEVVSGAERVMLTGGFTYQVSGAFLRGDSDGSGEIDLKDAITTLLFLFQGLRLTCVDAADFNDSGGVGLNDVLATLEFLFRSGPPPAAPYPFPGPDPSKDSFSCP